MKIGTKVVIAAGLALALLQCPVQAADEKPAAPKDQKEKMSYSIGMSIGNNIKRGAVELDVDVISAGIEDVLTGKPTRMTEQEAQEALMAYQQESRTKRDEERKTLAEKNKKEGEAFLAENKKKSGVKTHPVKLQDGTTAEMQYKIVKEGSGPIPKSNDTVTVNYRGTLINGKEFDSSEKRKEPAKFQVNRVVRGWTEALQMMPAGSKWELYIPAQLAYGDFPSGPIIEPGSTLIFEVELLGSETPPPPAPPQPLTSDIIKVPSAEELKKGAKVEILKAEDVEKLVKAAAATNAAATNKAEKK